MKKNDIKNIFRVALSNIMILLAGVATGFLIPKIFELTDYAYYKTYTLYTSYIGLLSLGIIDGIVLKYGNKNLEKLPHEKFRTFFMIYFILHFIITIISILIALFLFKGDNKILFFLLSLNIIATNVTGYFQQISQITQRFKEYSHRNILKSIFNIVIVLLLLFIYLFNTKIVNYKLYIILLLIVNYILTIWYIYTYRAIVFGTKKK